MSSKKEWKRRAKTAEALLSTVVVYVELEGVSGLLGAQVVRRGTTTSFPVLFASTNQRWNFKVSVS